VDVLYNCYNVVIDILLFLGMLISGELYIEFKDQAVKQSKIETMMKSISSHLGIEASGGTGTVIGNTSNGAENTTSQANSACEIMFL